MLLGAAALAQQNAPQNLPQPNFSTNGPAGTTTSQTTQQSNYPNGAQVDTTRSFQKTQTYGNTNGMLHAETKIQTTGPATTVNGQPVPTQETNPQ